MRVSHAVEDAQAVKQWAGLVQERDSSDLEESPLHSRQGVEQVRTLHTLCDLYQVNDHAREGLLALSKDSGKEQWLDTYPAELPVEYSNYILFESEARTVRNYESLFIAGLLQTPDFARAVIQGTLPLATTDLVEDRVRARLQRQELLHTPEPLKFHAVIDEAALRRMVGGRHVMREQLSHLVTMAELPHVDIRVIDLLAGAHPGMPGSFVLIDFPEDLAVVYIDSMAGDLFLEGEADVDRYSVTMDHLTDMALSPEQSQQLIADLSDGMTGET